MRCLRSGGTRLAFPLSMAMCGVLWLACGETETPGKRPLEPNLLFIVLDTLRADAIDCRNSRARTPNLCGLAERGVVFENAYAGGPWTLPSSVSMFSGSHATTYGRLPPDSARDLGVRNEFFQIPDAEVLLAEALATRGYEAMLFSEAQLPRQANAWQGFGEPTVDRSRAIADLRRLHPGLLGPDHTPPPLSDLGVLHYMATRRNQPFFLFVWIMDPHAPYHPSDAELEQLALGLPPLPHPPSFYRKLGHQDKPESDRYPLRAYAPFSPAEVELLVRLYLLEVKAVDERVGRLLELLRARGLDEETLVVVTSDHGEGFGEHGRFLHGNSFYEELLKVPLLMAGPGLPSGSRVTERVSSIDVMPTLCDLMSAGCLADAQGRSLRPLLSGRPDASERVLYAAAPLRSKLRDALIEGDYKLITNASGATELYDLARDPEEREDLSGERPDRVRAMQIRLEAIRGENEARRKVNQAALSEAEREETNQGTLEQLRALGYIE